MMENHKLKINNGGNEPFQFKEKKGESGFSLIEVIIALIIMLVALLGIFAAFTFATTYNAGNSRRSQALSVLQEEVELLRSKKFTPSFCTAPDADLIGGTKAAKTVTSKGDGGTYTVQTIVDDDPFTGGVQVNCAQTLKEITIVVTPQAVNGNWVIAFPVRVVFRRVRAN
jgi:prepilin-type N-terminal cleavage/methylation domain-containing protein